MSIYEQFIGQHQKRSRGAFYTPPFLVDYILANTVEKYFKSNSNTYSCPVLDPSCGSGIFLVEALRKIIEQFKLNNPDSSENKEKYKKNLCELVKNNIFGIDVDKTAIDVAIFSLYLTLLDYQESKDIENFKFPILFETNFFNNDYFDETAKFNDILKKKNIKFIIGNPPWGKLGKKEPYNIYINKRAKYEKEIFRKQDNISKNNLIECSIGGNEIAQAFLIRTSDFCDKQTKCSFIVTSKIFYNLQSKKFRKYLLKNYFIEMVFELAAVRRKVFDKSDKNSSTIAPPSIIFFSYANGQNTENNLIEHIALKPNRFFSLFKMFLIEKYDVKEVIQKKLLEYDWLWKVLVYGNYLDFNFLEHLKKDYKTIYDVLGEKRINYGQGIMIEGSDKNKSTHLKGMPILNTKKDLLPFYINKNIEQIFNKDYIHRPKPKSRFKAPMLLFAGGLTKDLSSLTGICYEDILYKSSIIGINVDNKNIHIIKNICGFFCSNVFSYLSLHLGSVTGIEREEIHDNKRLNFPFINSKKLEIIVSELETLQNEYYNYSKITDKNFKNTYNNNLKMLNKVVIEYLNLNSIEKALIDYATKITIPLIMQQKNNDYLFKSIKFNDKYLLEYISVFSDYYKPLFKKNNKYFKTEIWYSKNIIGLKFKIVDSKPSKEIIWYEDSNNNLLNIFAKISYEKITRDLFIQKDIKGFEKDGFYIIKPNEYKCWHKAIGYLDFYEINDAILTEGSKDSCETE